MATCYAPTTEVLQMSPLFPDADDIFVFPFVPYGFVRRHRYKQDRQTFADQYTHLMPQSIIRRFEFIIRFLPEHGIDRSWTDDILEPFIDRHWGPALPFYIVAPDTGETHIVRFSDEQFSLGIVNAMSRAMELRLIEDGDSDNTIDNGLVYPAHVESTTTATLSTTTTSTT